MTLAHWQARLFETFGYRAVLAFEREWYLLDAEGTPATAASRRDYLAQLESLAAARTLPLYALKCEDGSGQVEAALWPYHQMEPLLASYRQLETLASEAAARLGLRICTAPKPFPHDYGSALHVHLDLCEADGSPAYHRENGTMSQALTASIGGLLARLPACMPVFRGSDHAGARYVPGFHAPTTVSWGLNNRTTALRLPDPVSLSPDLRPRVPCPPGRARRIEHRVPASDADPEAVATLILEAVHDGLSRAIPAPAPIYGNAHDTQYALKRLR